MTKIYREPDMGTEFLGTGPRDDGMEAHHNGAGRSAQFPSGFLFFSRILPLADPAESEKTCRVIERIVSVR